MITQSTFDNKLKVASQRDPVKDLAIELITAGITEVQLMELIKGNELTPDIVKSRLHNYYRDCIRNFSQ